MIKHTYISKDLHCNSSLGCRNCPFPCDMQKYQCGACGMRIELFYKLNIINESELNLSNIFEYIEIKYDE